MTRHSMIAPAALAAASFLCAAAAAAQTVSIYWQAERPDTQIPAEYLPKGR